MRVLAVAVLLLCSAFTTSASAQPGRGAAPRFVHVATGDVARCALDAQGRAWCWGANANGQLGARTPEKCGRRSEEGSRGCWLSESDTAVAVSGGMRFTALSAGARHACGLATDGGVWCWGDGLRNALGGGVAADRCPGNGPCAITPVRAAGDLRFRSISSYGESTCGVAVTGAALCWGGRWGASPRPLASGTDFVAVSLGPYVCAVRRDGRAVCSGDNDHGELGTGDVADRTGAADVADVARFTQVAVGGLHACALAAGGRAWCWGADGVDGVRGGPLGTDSIVNLCKLGWVCSAVPVPVSGGRRFASISVGSGGSCGLTAAGELWCWGDNQRGRLGIPPPGPDDCRYPGTRDPKPCALRPTRAHPELRFRHVSYGYYQTCGATMQGAVVCWDGDSGGKIVVHRMGGQNAPPTPRT